MQSVANFAKGYKMAALMTCPNCGSILKEEGDETKSTKNSYRVYDSLSNTKHTKGAFRVIECLVCEFICDSDKWE